MSNNLKNNSINSICRKETICPFCDTDKYITVAEQETRRCESCGAVAGIETDSQGRKYLYWTAADMAESTRP